MNCWRQTYILSLWTEEKSGSSGRGLYDERSKEVNFFFFQMYIYNKHRFWQCSWILMSIRME